MNILIDYREIELIKICKNIILSEEKYKNVELKTDNLVLGDIIIKNNDMECLIIERKTIPDLLASIKDGRYTDQVFRFNKSSFHTHNVFYLIEGIVTQKYSLQEKQTLFSSMFSLSYMKGFSVIRSFNIQETGYMICNMMFKLHMEEQKGNKKFYQNFHDIEIKQFDDKKEINLCEFDCIKENENIKEEEKELKEFSKTIKKQKKNENITPDNIAIIFLCQIPGVNNIFAIEIMKHFKNIGELIQKIKETNETTQDYSFLYELKYTTDSNKERKISKNAIENIIKFLL